MLGEEHERVFRGNSDAQRVVAETEAFRLHKFTEDHKLAQDNF